MGHEGVLRTFFCEDCYLLKLNLPPLHQPLVQPWRFWVHDAYQLSCYHQAALLELELQAPSA
jgi:hypothetical protein